MDPWLWPLQTISRKDWSLPEGPGAFGAARTHDVHTGVDLYCPEGTSVHAVAEGVVLRVVEFTGSKAKSPWWLDTQAVMIFHPGIGTVLYGEIRPDAWVRPRARVRSGACIGWVKRVLRTDKGRPTAMLHLERYWGGYDRDPAEWLLGKKQPRMLLDPTPELRRALEGK